MMILLSTPIHSVSITFFTEFCVWKQIKFFSAYEQLFLISSLFYLLVMLLFYIQFYMIFHFLICAVRSRGHGNNLGQGRCGLWKEV